MGTNGQLNGAPRVSLNIVNLETATFDCTFGRGCDGKCCRNGRPPVTPDEVKIIRSQLKRALPFLTPNARKLIEREGFLSNRIKMRQKMLRVVDGWCVFFNEGCVLHKLGATDGDSYKYKPAICALFPLEPALNGNWYIRQQGFQGEDWNLECLHPDSSDIKAALALKTEIALAEKLVALKKFDFKKDAKKVKAKAAKARR